MLIYKYVDENGLAAILATKKSAGVAPKMNLRECTSHTPPPNANKAAHSGFEIQRRYHQKSKNAGICGPTKGYVSNKNLKKRKKSVRICQRN